MTTTPTHSSTSSLTLLGRLTWTELKLMAREPMVLAFVLAFPVLFTLILGGVFERDDEAFGALPSDYYGVAYIAVAIGAVGLTAMPVQVAAYRERGVLRRFRASGMASWLFPAAMVIVGVIMSIIAAVLVVITTKLTYGLAAPANWVTTIIYGLLATMSFVSLGVLLGWLMPNARSAQGLGTLAFFPMFLLGGGGPPPDALSDVMNDIASFLPLTHVMRTIQEPWLALDGGGTNHLLILLGVGFASTVGWISLSRRAAV